MSRGLFLLLVLLLALGCQNNPIVMQNQIQSLQQQQLALAQQNRELQQRATTLDQDNQELETLLAQARQQSLVIEDQLVALREQLSHTAMQLADVRSEKDALENKTNSLVSTIKERASATITANNSLRGRLPPLDIPGVEVRLDGDVVRIELPADQLFAPGTAQMQQGAARLLDQVAAEVYRAYPNQIIGIEGHTDNAVVRSTRWPNSHQLSVGQATTVFEHLVLQSRIPAERLFVVGHGGNHPIVSNATPAGRQRNRRVELVIYPETSDGR